jgi:hypothetical protein
VKPNADWPHPGRQAGVQVSLKADTTTLSESDTPSALASYSWWHPGLMAAG